MGRLRDFLACTPVATEAISVTGSACALKCAHCGGHYLSAMTPLGSIASAEDLRGSSCLISGGCDASGKVGVLPHLAHLQAIKGQHKFNFHVGLLSEDEIKAIAPLADTVSFDFVGSNNTIKETLKLDKTVEDYLTCYRHLRRYCHSVVPHICIGLHGGQLEGEQQALALLAQEGVEKLVFIVLIPTKGTEYAENKPPALPEVVSFLEYARQTLPEATLYLGCMRPGGNYRRQLDRAAVELGLDGIVQPTRAAVARARELGRNIITSEECCAL